MIKMKIDYTNFMVALIITLLPVIILKYRGLEKPPKGIGKLLITGWGMLALLFTLLLDWLSKTPISWITIIPTILIGCIYCYFVIMDHINLKHLIKSTITVLLFFCSSLLQLIPILLFKITAENTTPMIDALLVVFSDTILVILLILLYRQDLKRDWQSFWKNRNQMLDDGFRFWILGFVLMMASNLLIQLLAPQSVAANEEAVQNMLKMATVPTFICTTILAPFIEEMVFRKSFKEVFKTKWLFAFTSGLVFGGLHVILSFTSAWDLLYIIPYSSLGVAFALLCYKTDNIFPSITVHTLHNLLVTSISIMGMMVIL